MPELFIPFGDFAPDTGVRTGDMAMVMNAIPYRGHYLPPPYLVRRSATIASGASPSPGKPEHMHVIPSPSTAGAGALKTPYHVHVARSDGHVYAADTTVAPWTWAQLTAAGALTFEDFWTVQYGPYTIYCLGHTAHIRYTDAGFSGSVQGPLNTDLITSAVKPRARFAMVLGHQLILGNLASVTSEDPINAAKTVDEDMVWASEFDQIRLFSTTNSSGFSLLYDELGPITSMMGGREWGSVFKARGIYRAELGDYFPLRYTAIPRSLGTLYPKSVVAAGNLIFFMGPNGPAVFDGFKAEDLGYGRHGRLLFDKNIQDDLLVGGVTSAPNYWQLPDPSTDVDRHTRISGVYDAASECVHWYYRTANGVPTGHGYDRVLTYSIRDNRASVAFLDYATEQTNDNTVRLHIGAVGSIPPGAGNWGPHRDTLIAGELSRDPFTTYEQKVYGSEIDTDLNDDDLWNVAPTIFRKAFFAVPDGPFSINAFRLEAEVDPEQNGDLFEVNINDSNAPSGGSPDAFAGEDIDFNAFDGGSGHTVDADGFIALANPSSFAKYHTFELRVKPRYEEAFIQNPTQSYRLFRGVTIRYDAGGAGV